MQGPLQRRYPVAVCQIQGVFAAASRIEWQKLRRSIGSSCAVVARDGLGATCRTTTLPERSSGASGHWLDLWVTDNGHGGAAPVAGHGLAGLDERVRGLGGMLVVDSPAGGPTVIGAHFPFVPEARVGA